MKMTAYAFDVVLGPRAIQCPSVDQKFVDAIIGSKNDHPLLTEVHGNNWAVCFMPFLERSPLVCARYLMKVAYEGEGPGAWGVRTISMLIFCMKSTESNYKNNSQDGKNHTVNDPELIPAFL